MTWLLTFGLLTAPPAIAGSGQHNAFGPYDVNPALTEGQAEGFRQLYVDPARLGELLQPSEALADTADDVLEVENRTSAWSELTVAGVRVGIVGPLTTVVLHGVKPGAYEAQLLGPTGFTTSRTFTSASYVERKAAAEEAARLAAEEEAAAQEEGEAETAEPAE